MEPVVGVPVGNNVISKFIIEVNKLLELLIDARPDIGKSIVIVWNTDHLQLELQAD